MRGIPRFHAMGISSSFKVFVPAGLGGIDLWVSNRNHTHDDFNWEPAVNLGAAVNSSSDDNAPSYFDNDELNVAQLYFVSTQTGWIRRSRYLP